ncbi:TPA: A24 family peptidase [Citrobacter pasteurii]|uniref:prepilin peptidase n=1 Tax=Citrobacter sp. Cu233 TaxID=2985160 RepID=UPI0025771B9B|nr:A24 family peptidase [Citrobacter sp. Cu233]MDM2936079.1 A24 family peptidase [Citrobacter sp. Cu233]
MNTELPFLLIYLSLSGLLGVQDLRTGLLPDKFTCPLLWSGLLFYQCCNPTQLSDALWGAIAGYGVFSLFYWGYRLAWHQEGLGYGDVKFLAALGAWHRWDSLPLLVLLAAGLACCMTGVAFITHGKKKLKNPLPFGPYLAAAGFVVGWLNLIQGG